MATFGALSIGDGTVQLTSSGVGAAFAKITNTTTGVLIYNGSYNNSSLVVNDNGPSIAVSNSYSCAYSSTLNGAPVGTLTASATPTVVNNGSLSVTDQGGGYIGASWSYPYEGSSSISPYSVNLWQTINGVQTLVGSMSYPQSSVSWYVGYSTTVSLTMAFYYSNSYGGVYTAQNAANASITTVPAPPPAPNPATNGIVTADNQSSSVSIAWTASVGGATGYYVYRSIAGAAYTYLGSTVGTTWTDSSTGATRPITYEIMAYNSNAGGTTTAGSYTYATTLAPITDTVNVLWTTNALISKARNIQYTVFNLRLIPDGAAAASGLTGAMSDIQDDPANYDANFAIGTAPWDVRLTFADPSSQGMQTPTGRQRFRVVVRTAP